MTTLRFVRALDRPVRTVAQLDQGDLDRHASAIRWHYADQGLTVRRLDWAVDDVSDWARSLLAEDTDAETVLIATVRTVRTRAVP